MITMRALVRTRPGDPDVPQVKSDYPTPSPKKEHILVQVKCCGLNRSELRSRAGDPHARGEFTSDEVFTDMPPAIHGEEYVRIVVDNGFACTSQYRLVCVTGVLTKVWALKEWAPADGIESGKKIISYQSPKDKYHDGLGQTLNEIVEAVEDGSIAIDRFNGKTLEEPEGIAEGHRLMEEVEGRVVVKL
ncbi:uncharacterized protein N0V89_005095 [Didymosphaeria variabile]|uniref:GroES-like protein n=1 Tax=Didymosphaeria variabile TaxID=1932322 RepID=A0A9W8XKQ9_9PLEO|nr:uncharacterized protein N0V89_005095 [Didymosphaeria variabile]KAJ4353366.1 hypothetical protein N0V89_005095 [Didymosphaeria variabile]